MEQTYYYKLFKFFSDQHNLTLLDSEIEDIIKEVEKFTTISKTTKISGNKIIAPIDTKFILWLTELQKVTEMETKGGQFKINREAAREFFNDGYTPYQCFREAYDCDGD